MGRKSKPTTSQRTERKGKDAGKKFKKKVCVFCKEGVTWIDYKDVNLLRRFMSDRAKIRARRVSGNCA
jgi:small subunit ribosomal protein S18